MKRKDCETVSAQRRTGIRSALRTRLAAGAILAWATLGLVAPARAGAVRLLKQAVVIQPVIQVCDVAEPTGFAPAEQEDLCAIVVTDAPVVGGTRVVPLGAVRDALASRGVNLAKVTFSGSAVCDVTRPLEIEAMDGESRGVDGPAGASSAGWSARRDDGHARGAGTGLEAVDAEGSPSPAPSLTLRDFLTRHFDRELSPYGGRAELVFDRGTQDALRLSGPEFSFSIRQRKGPALGLISLEIDLIRDGVTVRTLPVVVRVSMIRPTLLARRAINQGATIGAADVEVADRAAGRIDGLPLSDAASAVGLRALRFIPAGAAVDAEALETAPVVMRGQLVALSSSVGGVSVTTTAKAAEDGLLGHSIRVRSPDNKRIEFDAVVVGPGRVRIGEGASPPTDVSGGERLAVRPGENDE